MDILELKSITKKGKYNKNRKVLKEIMTKNVPKLTKKKNSTDCGSLVNPPKVKLNPPHFKMYKVTVNKIIALLASKIRGKWISICQYIYQPTPHFLYKPISNCLKVDYRHTYKTENYKTSR